MPETYALQTVVIALNAGILAILISDRLVVPSIAFYLIIGIFLGPYFLNLVQPQSLGNLLPVIIELGVALIMFEGAIHLNIKQYREASRAIRNLVTIGVVVSVISIMLLTRWLFAWPWGICLLFGVLMSVTGPTVIAPILRKVPLKQPIGSILHWEAILLEPIVVIGAILTVEFLILTDVTVWDTLLRLLKITIVGGIVGSLSGWLLAIVLKRIPPKQEAFRNLSLLAVALLIFEVSNLVTADSGLLALVFAGLILGNASIPALFEIKQFKETITRVMISFLFVLLAANLNVNELVKFSTPVIFLLIAIMFIIRPTVIFTSMIGSKIDTPSKVFLSLTGPRGIVAASMASLLTIVFAKGGGADQAAKFEILAYQVIIVTVFTEALWSWPLATWLKVREKEKRGFLIIGAHPLGVEIAKWMNKNGVETVLVDRDSYDVYLAKKQGLNAYKGDALNEAFLSELPLLTVGNLLALTSNDEVNTLACQLGKRYFGQDHLYQIHKTLNENEAGFLKSAGGKLVFPKTPSIFQTIGMLGDKKWIVEEKQGMPEESDMPLILLKNKGWVLPVQKDTVFNEESVFLNLRSKKKAPPPTLGQP